MSSGIFTLARLLGVVPFGYQVTSATFLSSIQLTYVVPLTENSLSHSGDPALYIRNHSNSLCPPCASWKTG